MDKFDKLDIHNPATGQLITTLPADDAASVAIDAAIHEPSA